MTDKTPARPEILAALVCPLVIDVRDQDERTAGKGGPPGVIEGSVHVPLNIDGQKQSVRETTSEEFVAKLLLEGGIDVTAEEVRSRSIITHCGTGGRGAKAADILRSIGCDAHNGGSTAHISASCSTL